jgi:PKD repeat protein
LFTCWFSASAQDQSIQYDTVRSCTPFIYQFRSNPFYASNLKNLVAENNETLLETYDEIFSYSFNDTVNVSVVYYSAGAPFYTEYYRIEVGQPPVLISGLNKDRKICPGEPVTLGIDKANLVSWKVNEGAEFSGNNIRKVYSVPGSYRVIANGNAACGNFSTAGIFTVDENTAPVDPTIYTGSKESFCPGEKIQLFTDKWSYAGYRWENGDAKNPQVSNQIIPTFSYPEQGEYRVKLEVTNLCGIKTSAETVINVFPVVQQSSVVIDYKGYVCPGEPVRFQVGNEYSDVTWREQETVIGQGNIFEYAFTSQDVHYINVSATDACGNINDGYAYVSVSSESFSESNPIVSSLSETCEGGRIEFWSNERFKEYEWISESGVKYGERVSFIFNGSGEHKVTLRALNYCGMSLTYETTVRVGKGQGFRNIPVSISGPGFFGKEKFCPGEPMAFSASGEGIVAVNWNFGDGKGTDTREASHSYAGKGIYYPSVTLKNQCGFDTTIYADAVIVGEGLTYNDYVSFSRPEIYTDENSVYCVGEPVQLRVMCTGVKYNYDFGDNSYAQGDYMVMQLHPYDKEGVYNVKVTVINGCGNEIILSKDIEVGTRKTFNRNSFGLGSANLCIGEFYQSIHVGLSKLQWQTSFSDGIKEATPLDIEGVKTLRLLEKFPESGIHTIKTIATDYCGNSYEDSVKIVVNAGNAGGSKPGIELLTLKEEFTTCDTIAFATGNGGEFTWDFGTGLPPVNTKEPLLRQAFPEPGSYSVGLTVRTSCNSALVADNRVQVNVKACPVPEIRAIMEADKITGQAPLVVTFNGLATGTTDKASYKWFVNGVPVQLTGRLLTYTFLNEGEYNVKFVAEERGGVGADSIKIKVFDCGPLKPDFEVQPVCKGSEAIYTPAGIPSAGLYTYKWLLNGEMISTANVLTWSFPEIGEYHLALQVSNQFCSKIAEKSVIVEDVNLSLSYAGKGACETDSVIYLTGKDDEGGAVEWLPAGAFRSVAGGVFYHLSDEDKLAGKVTVTLNSLSAACKGISRSVEINVDRVPVLEVGRNRKLTADPVVINATVKPEGTAVMWFAAAGNGRFDQLPSPEDVVYYPSDNDVKEGFVRLTLRTIPKGCPVVMNSIILTNKVETVCNIKLNKTNPSTLNPNLYTFWASNDDNTTIGNYHWNFGDGNSASGKIQSNIYNRAGQYVVKLTYSNFDSSCTAVTYDTVTVSQESIPTYSIAGNISAGTNPLDKGKALLFKFNGKEYQYLREQLLVEEKAGNYLFTGLENGFYVIYAQPDTASLYFSAYKATYSGSVTEWRKGGLFVRINNQDTAGVNIALVHSPSQIPAGGKDMIAGRIVFGEGFLSNLRITAGSENPVENAVVTLYNVSGDRLTSTYTDPYGNYSFEGLPEGSYNVGVEYPGTDLTNTVRVEAGGNGGLYNGDGVLNGAVQGTTDPQKSESAIRLYPNPAAEILIAELPVAVESLVKIYSITGIVQKEFKGWEKVVQMDVSDLKSGIYIIEITGQGNKQTSRFTKN